MLMRGVRVEIPANTPMVLLQEQDGEHRLLPIYIGGQEASSIHYALEGIEPARPLTHDLFLNTLLALGAKIDRVVLTEVRDHTFYAELHVIADDVEHIVSSRPSDAIALAVRCDAPLFATDKLLDEVGQVPSDDSEVEADEIIDEFKDFIDSITPDDFAT